MQPRYLLEKVAVQVRQIAGETGSKVPSLFRLRSFRLPLQRPISLACEARFSTPSTLR